MKVDFTISPWVYLDRERRSFIRIRSAEVGLAKARRWCHWFLTIESGMIDVAKIEETSQRFSELKPQPDYDRRKALQHYLGSTLGRTPIAEREIALLLNGPMPGCTSRKIVAPEMDDSPPLPGKSSASGDGFTVADLAAEFGIEPGHARKILRRRMSKPGGRWEWPTPAAARDARAILDQELKS